MKKRVIFFNGPPRSGKDTAGTICLGAFGPLAAMVKFAQPVKAGAHASYGLGNLPIDHFEGVKDEPLDDFLGFSPRQAYIKHSELYMKPVHGQDVFGRLAAQFIRRTNLPLFFVTDSGFKAEAEPVVELVGKDNALLIQVERKGCDFSNDSRSYITLPGVWSWRVFNRDLEVFKVDIRRIVGEWLNP